MVQPKTNAADLSDSDWQAKWIEVSELFCPTAPVEETDLFAGRTMQIAKLMDVAFQRGQHAIVYGDRGVGKTSLINTFQKKAFPSSSIILFFAARCFAGDNFMEIWVRAFGDHKWENGEYAADDIDSTINPPMLLELMSQFKKSIVPVFIFDEFDRIMDAETKLKMAETVKLFSDESSHAKIVIVGIGRTIRDLLNEHESVRRALRQVQMPRMSADEIKEIVMVRLARVAMTIDPSILEMIVALARGMPGYAHLIALHAARAATRRKSLDLNTDDITAGLYACIEEAGESTRQDYAKAIQSAKPNNQFKEALLACALAKQDEYGAFTAASVREPISSLLKEQKDIPAFARHLTAFCSEERGPILEKDGTPKNYRYRFIDPIMQPFVITRGLHDKMVFYDPEKEAIVFTKK